MNKIERMVKEMFELIQKHKHLTTSCFYFTASIFCVLFNYVHQILHITGSVPYFRFLFLVPLIASFISILSYFGYTWQRNRISYHLFNAMVLVVMLGLVTKGIFTLLNQDAALVNVIGFIALTYFVASYVLGILPDRIHKKTFHFRKTIIKL